MSREKYKHVGYCEDCVWEGYFKDDDKCPNCGGELVSVKTYKEV